MAAPKPPALPNIETLIEEDGQITVGHLDPVGVVAIANDEHNALAMLRRRQGESLGELLRRLDAAVHLALEEDERTDEINPPPDAPH
jgi:predicted RNase H-like HicB family nuclease